MSEISATPSSDERLMAAISHFFGFLVALIVWAFQKDRSRFLRFQAAQAMAFDLLGTVISFLVVGGLLAVVIIPLLIGIGDLAIFGPENNPAAEPARVLVSLMQTVPFLVACIVSLLVGSNIIIRLIATIQTFRGIDFYYPWLGRLVERVLSG